MLIKFAKIAILGEVQGEYDTIFHKGSYLRNL